MVREKDDSPGNRAEPDDSRVEDPMQRKLRPALQNRGARHKTEHRPAPPRVRSTQVWMPSGSWCFSAALRGFQVNKPPAFASLQGRFHFWNEHLCFGG